MTEQVLGLVDWNPAGASILHTYKYGGRQSLEGRSFTLPSLRWLGLRACMLPTDGRSGRLLTGAGSGLLPLTRRDRALAAGMMARLQGLGEDAWRDEVRGREHAPASCNHKRGASTSSASGDGVPRRQGAAL